MEARSDVEFGLNIVRGLELRKTEFPLLRVMIFLDVVFAARVSEHEARLQI